MLIDDKTAAGLLEKHDKIVIFCHAKPDGDTVGSAFALLRALELLGKTARIECADPLLCGKLADIFAPYEPKSFTPEFLVAVDVADEKLLEGIHKPYGGEIGLCIDHHKSNTFFAKYTLLDIEAAAAAQIVFRVVGLLGITGDKPAADAAYTGISTDTACFRHANTTPEALCAAAQMMRWGADTYRINKLMYATKSRAQIAAEAFLLGSLEYDLDGRYAQIFLPLSIYKDYGVTEDELDGVSAIPRMVRGVLAGVTIREKEDGEFRVSMRTEDPLDAAGICAAFGGGGHKNAAGCTMQGGPSRIKELLMAEVRKAVLI
ncbi:MAG: bifunctional oligoribonuclease/PAP phosphatase NrnA [Oscillospiraceae bacterium]|nr:bifunctional oligoribonuclease/PAP phosphatase NrnA [Oscillospiraceae bacterium]